MTTVVIRDTNWTYHFFKSTEEVNNFVKKNLNEYDFIFDSAGGAEMSIIYVTMVKR